MMGGIDRSELHIVKGSAMEGFEIGEKLQMKNEVEILARLGWGSSDLISMEDPDIWIDENNDDVHLYFSLAFIDRTDPRKNKVHLGHAVGKDLRSLTMTMPVLLQDAQGGAKELSVAPVNKDGIRLNLVESAQEESDHFYSVVRLAIADDMGKGWRFGGTVFHPKEHSIPWIAGHASPGPLFSKKFIDIGSGKSVGLLNGREADRCVGGRTKFGMFSIGLFIYDHENGKIDWVSPEPFIQDIEAKTITFASQFVETGNGKGILYAHVDDSFVRAYALKAELLASVLKAGSLS